MWYEGRRKSVPSSHYGTVDLEIIEGWMTWDEWMEQPQDLQDELRIRYVQRNKAETRERKRVGKSR